VQQVCEAARLAPQILVGDLATAAVPSEPPDRRPSAPGPWACRSTASCAMLSPAPPGRPSSARRAASHEKLARAASYSLRLGSTSHGRPGLMMGAQRKPWACAPTATVVGSAIPESGATGLPASPGTDCRQSGPSRANRASRSGTKPQPCGQFPTRSSSRRPSRGCRAHAEMARVLHCLEAL